MNIISSPTRRQLLRRVEPPRAIIIHSSGDTNLEKIMAFYNSPDGFQPHYFIATDGSIYQIADEALVAYHCALYASEERYYRQGFGGWSKYGWDTVKKVPVALDHGFDRYAFWHHWLDSGIQSPIEFPTSARPNVLSIGIECQASEHPTEDVFTDAQYDALAGLAIDICRRNHIPIDRKHLLGHQDVTPMRRTSPKGGWDPGDAFNWEWLLDSLNLIA